MGRWSHLDTDAERLPDGMTRIGYDADTQVYTYRDNSDGSYWEGAPGVQYGKLHRVRAATPPRLPSVFIPDNVEGEEPGYVLHDEDEDDDSEDEDLKRGNSDEKKVNVKSDAVAPGLASPTKARLHNHPHPALGKTLPDLPDDADKMSGTTVTVGYPYSEATVEAQTHNNNNTTLKRSGTLSRIARFLSGGSSSTPTSSSTTNPRPRRRATVASRSEALARFGHRHHQHEKKDAKEVKIATPAVTGDRWPGQASNGGNPPPPQLRKRATTFDEILASM